MSLPFGAPILAVDSATGPCSVAIVDGHGSTLAHVREERTIMQARRLVPMIEEALQEAGLRYRDLGGMAATVGPGSFTGIRVGLAALRGAAFAAGKTVYGVTTLQCLAMAANADNPHNLPVLSALRAGKGEVYCQFAPLWGDEIQLIAYEKLTSAITQPCLLAGNIADEWQTQRDEPLPARITIPSPPLMLDAVWVARCTVARAGQRTLLAPSPIYIRPPDAKLPTPRA